MDYYPPPPGSGRRPSRRRPRDDFDQFGVSLSPLPPPPGAGISDAQERSRQATDQFFDRATGGQQTPRVPGLLGLPSRGIATAPAPLQAPPTLPQTSRPAQQAQIRDLRAETRQWTPSERQNLEQAAGYVPRQPSNPAAHINETRAERAMRERAGVAQSTLAGIRQQDDTLAEQLRQQDEDMVRRQKERAARTAHGVNEWETKGFFVDDKGRLRPRVNESGHQYHIRRDDGSVASLQYDPITGRATEVDPLQAGVFEQDEQGNKIVRVAGEGRTPTIIERNLALDDREAQQAAEAEAARQTKLIDAEGKLRALDTKDAGDEVTAARAVNSETEKEQNQALQAYGVKPGMAHGFYRAPDGRLRPLVRPDGFQRHERRPDGNVVAVFYDAATGQATEYDPAEAGTFETDATGPDKGTRFVRVAGETEGGKRENLPAPVAPETPKQLSTFDKVWNAMKPQNPMARVQGWLSGQPIIPTPDGAQAAPTAPPPVPAPVQARQEAAAAVLQTGDELQKAQEAHDEVDRAVSTPVSANPLAGIRPGPTPIEQEQARKSLEAAKLRHEEAKTAEREALRREIAATRAAIQLGAKGITLAQAKSHPRYASDAAKGQVAGQSKLFSPAQPELRTPIDEAKAKVGVGGSAWNEKPSSTNEPSANWIEPVDVPGAGPMPTAPGATKANQGGAARDLSGAVDARALVGSGIAAAVIGDQQEIEREKAREAALKPVKDAIDGLVRATVADSPERGPVLTGQAAGERVAAAAQATGATAAAIRDLVDTYAVGAATALKTGVLAEKAKLLESLLAQATAEGDADAARMRKAGALVQVNAKANMLRQQLAEAKAQQPTVEQTVRRDIFKAVGPVYSSGYGIPVEEQLATIARWGKESGAPEDKLADMRNDAMQAARGEVVGEALKKALVTTGGNRERAEQMVRMALYRNDAGANQSRATMPGKTTPAERRAVFDLAGDIKAGLGDLVQRAKEHIPSAWAQVGDKEAAFALRHRPDEAPGMYEVQFPSAPGQTFQVQMGDEATTEQIIRKVFHDHYDKFSAGSATADAVKRIVRDGIMRPALMSARGVLNVAGMVVEAGRYAATGKSDAAKFGGKEGDAAKLAQLIEGATGELVPTNAVYDLKAKFSTGEQLRQNILQGLGQIPLTIAMGTAGGTAGLFGMNAAQMGTQSFDEAIASGASEEKAFTAMLLNGGIGGAVETVADNFVFLKPLKAKIPSSLVKSVARAAAEGMVVEGGTEGAQQIWQNIVARVYDENRKMFEGVPMSAVVGAIIGAGAQAGLTGVGQYAQARAAQKQQAASKANAATNTAASSPEAAAATQAAYTPTDAGTGTAPSHAQAMDAAANSDKEVAHWTPHTLGGDEALATVADGLGLPPEVRAHVGFDATMPSDGLALAVGLAEGGTAAMAPDALAGQGIIDPFQQDTLMRIAQGQATVGAAVDAVIAGEDHPGIGILMEKGILDADGRFNPAAVELLPPLARKRVNDLLDTHPEMFGENDPAALRGTVAAGRQAFDAMAAGMVANGKEVLDLPEVAAAAIEAVNAAATANPTEISTPLVDGEQPATTPAFTEDYVEPEQATPAVLREETAPTAKEKGKREWGISYWQKVRDESKNPERRRLAAERLRTLEGEQPAETSAPVVSEEMVEPDEARKPSMVLDIGGVAPPGKMANAETRKRVADAVAEYNSNKAQTEARDYIIRAGIVQDEIEADKQVVEALRNKPNRTPEENRELKKLVAYLRLKGNKLARLKEAGKAYPRGLRHAREEAAAEQAPAIVSEDYVEPEPAAPLTSRQTASRDRYKRIRDSITSSDLTKGEREMFEQLAAGSSNADIDAERFIARITEASERNRRNSEAEERAATEPAIAPEAPAIDETAPEPAVGGGQANTEERQAKIDEIVSLSERPSSKIVERTLVKGTDGKWYTGIGGTPGGVSLTDERSEPYFVRMSPEGTTFGNRFPTREAAEADDIEKGQRAADDMRRAMEEEPDEKLDSQLDYWRGERDKRVRMNAPLPPMKPRGSARIEERRLKADEAKFRKRYGRDITEADRKDWETVQRVEGKQYKSSQDEKLAAIAEGRLKADISKWKPGMGIQYPVMASGGKSQINRGFRVMEVDAENRRLLVKPVRDTGLTSSGGDNDVFRPMWIDLYGVKRDRASDAPAPSSPPKANAPGAEATPPTADAAGVTRPVETAGEPAKSERGTGEVSPKPPTREIPVDWPVGSPIHSAAERNTVSEEKILSALKTADAYETPAYIGKRRETANMAAGEIQVSRTRPSALLATVYPGGRVEIEEGAYRPAKEDKFAARATAAGLTPAESALARSAVEKAGGLKGDDFTHEAFEDPDVLRRAAAHQREVDPFERAQSGDETAYDEMDAAFRARYPEPDVDEGDALEKAFYTPDSFERAFEAAFAAKDFDAILEAVKETDRGVWVPLLKKFFRQQADDPVAAAKAEWLRHVFNGTRPPDAKARTAPPPPKTAPKPGPSTTPPRSAPPPPKTSAPPPKPPPPPPKPPPAPTPPPPRRIPVSEIKGQVAKSPFKIIEDFSKAIGKHLHVRRMGRRQLGTYRPGSTATAIRFASDLDTAAHELAGHWTDDKTGLGKPWMTKGAVSPYDKELATFWIHGSPSKSLKIRRAEGIAEYVRARVMNPDAARAQAPLFTAYFDRTIPRPMMAALDQFSNDVRVWAGEQPLRRAGLNIRMEPPGRWESLRKSILGDNREFSKSGIDKFRSWFDDSYHYAVKGWRAALQMQGRDINDVRPSENFDLMLRLLSSHDARLSDQLENGLIPLNPRQITNATTSKLDVNRATDPVTKQAMNLPWLIEPFDNSNQQAQEQDMREASAMMVAQRTLERAAAIDREAQAEIAALDPADPATPSRRRGILAAAEARKRNISGLGAGIMTDVEAARQAMADLGRDPKRATRLREAARRYRLWADQNLTYLVDSGRMSKQQADEIRDANQQYVDMHRLSEEFDMESRMSRGVGSVGTAKDVIKRFRGSSLEIDNVYKNLLAQTDAIQKEAIRNKTMQTFTGALESTRKLYEDDPVELDRIGSKVSADDRNTVKVWKNGKAEYWKLDPDIHEAVKGLGDLGSHAFVELLSAPQTLARYLITHSPAFMVRNPIRDTAHRAVVSEVGSKPWDILQGYSAADESRLVAFGGGQFGNYARDHLTWNRELKRGMEELRKDSRNIFLAPGKLKHGWEKLAAASETVGRVAEFRRAYDKGVNELGYPPEEAALYAAGEARGLMDYAKMGSVMRTINRLIPFSNAHLRGLAKGARTATRDPGGFAVRWSLYALAPTLLVRALAHMGPDEEEYLQLPAWQRDFFWNIKVGNHWLRIPKPHELGVMAGGIERAIDAAMGAKKPFEGYGNSAQSAFTPIGGLAEATGPLKVPLEILFNRDTFRNRNIIPPWEEHLKLDLRKGTEHASGAGKVLGSLFGADPRYIDHAFQSFGGLGQSVTDFTSGSMPAGASAMKASGLVTMPPSTQSKDYQWVMDWARENGKTSIKAVKDLKDLVDPVFNAPDSGSADKAAKELRKQATELRKLIEAGTIKGGERKGDDAPAATQAPKPTTPFKPLPRPPGPAYRPPPPRIPRVPSLPR